MSRPDQPARDLVAARIPGAEMTPEDVALAELDRARHALAYLKEKLGNDAMRSLLADDLEETTERARVWLADSGGSWQSASLELTVPGPSAAEFHAWYEAMVGQGRQALMRAGHPEHFISHPQPQLIEVVENVGETNLPWHIFYRPLADDDPALPSKWDPDFPVRFGAEILDLSGTRIGFTMHEANDRVDGMHLKLTTHLPAAVPSDIVRRHLRHFAIEFTNWTRMARDEIETGSDA